MLKVRLREWITHHLLDLWFPAGRAYRLGISERSASTPTSASRTTRNLTDRSAPTSASASCSPVVLLVSFIGVLWILSEGVVIPFGGRDLAIPGYMVWAALLYAALGLAGSWRVGRPLVRLGAERYAREADSPLLAGAGRSAPKPCAHAGEADARRGTETAWVR